MNKKKNIRKRVVRGRQAIGDKLKVSEIFYDCDLWVGEGLVLRRSCT